MTARSEARGRGCTHHGLGLGPGRPHADVPARLEGRVRAVAEVVLRVHLRQELIQHCAAPGMGMVSSGWEGFFMLDKKRAWVFDGWLF